MANGNAILDPGTILIEVRVNPEGGESPGLAIEFSRKPDVGSRQLEEVAPRDGLEPPT
jgi:hypothetical protein